MMIRIADTPKPRDRFGSIPIRDGKPVSSLSSKPHPSRRPRTFSLRAWLKRIVTLLLGSLLLLGLGSPLLIPYLATTLLAEQLASALHRPVTIARGEFNPLTTTLTLHHLIVGPKLANPDDPVDPLLSAAKISIVLKPERLLDGKIVCTLGAEHFFLHLLRQKDGRYNLGQALDEILSGLPLLPLRFSCDAIALSNSRLVFDDAQTGKTHFAEEIALTLSSAGANGLGQASLLNLQATINGAPLTLAGATTLTADPAQPANPLPARHDQAKEEENGGDPGAPADPAAKSAEAIALTRELARAAEQYLQHAANPPGKRRTENPLAP